MPNTAPRSPNDDEARKRARAMLSDAALSIPFHQLIACVARLLPHIGRLKEISRGPETEILADVVKLLEIMNEKINSASAKDKALKEALERIGL